MELEPNVILSVREKGTGVSEENKTSRKETFSVWKTGVPPVEPLDEDNEYCYAFYFTYEGVRYMSNYLYKVNYEEGVFESAPRRGKDEKIIKIPFDAVDAWQKLDPYSDLEIKN